MSGTIVNQAVSAVLAALQGAPAVAPQVARVRLRPWGDGSTTAVAIKPLEARRDTSVMAYGGPDVWLVRLGVECYARAAVDADVQLDALVQAVHERLMTDPTLAGAVPGGLDTDSGGIAYDFDADGDQIGAATFIFTARMPSSGPSLT